MAEDLNLNPPDEQKPSEQPIVEDSAIFEAEAVVLPADEIAATEAAKTPFAETPASLSGMVSSVLNPQDDRTRRKIEREIKKRQEKLENPKFSKFRLLKKTALVLLVLLLLFGAVAVVRQNKNNSTVRRVYQLAKNNRLTRKFSPANNLRIWGSSQVTFENTFRVKIKSTTAADKATLIVSDGAKNWTVSGEIISRDEKSFTWDFMLGNLKKDSYTYKIFVKNSRTNQLKESRGEFELK